MRQAKILLALLLAVAAALALYTFLLIPHDLRSAAGLSGVEADRVASVTITFPWPGFAWSEDPALIAGALELLEDTAVSRRDYGHLLFSSSGNPYSISFTLTDGSVVSLQEAQQGFVFDEETFIAGLLTIADRCETKENDPHGT